MFDFSKVVDRHGTWCTQWDYVADRFGSADLLPFTISDMDFATAPCILEALTQRLSHGVLGYSRWKNDEFLAAISHWFLSRHNTQIDPQSLVYGPSVIYMVSELIRQWSSVGDAVVIHTPAYDAFYKAIEDNQRQVCAVGLEKRADGWFCDMVALEKALSRPESKILLLCSPQNPTGKVWTRDELETMAELCQRHGVKVISDEIHMDMVWSDRPHIPWSNVARGSWALLTSGSKSFNIPALTGAYGLIEDAQSRNDYLSALKGRDGLSSPAVLALSAHIAAYQQGASWLDALRDYLPAICITLLVSLMPHSPNSTGRFRNPPIWHGLTCVRSILMTMPSRMFSSTSRKSLSCRDIPTEKKVAVLYASMPDAQDPSLKKAFRG